VDPKGTPTASSTGEKGASSEIQSTSDMGWEVPSGCSQRFGISNFDIIHSRATCDCIRTLPSTNQQTKPVRSQAHSTTLFAGRPQVNASCRSHHWLDGHRHAQLSRAAGQTDSRIMVTSLLSEMKTQIPCSARLLEIISTLHYSSIWIIIILLPLKFTLWKSNRLF